MQLSRVMTIATLLTLAISAQGFTVQDPKRSSKDADHPKSEIDLMLEDADKRGEHIYATCIEPCKEDQHKSADGVEKGAAIELPQPAYPAIAVAAHVSGTVQVRVIVDEEGKVIAAHAISGHPLLQATSVSAARNARFKPWTLNGSPVKVTGVINYNFVP
jgi:TonB family protein